MKKIGLVLFVLAACVGLVVAATVTNFTGSATSLPATGKGVVVVQNTITFTDNPAVTGTVYDCIGVPANCTVLAVGYNVGTVNTTVDTDTFDIGDADSASLFKNGGSMQSSGTAQASVTGKVYPAAGLIKVTSEGTITNGVLTVWAVIAGAPDL